MANLVVKLIIVGSFLIPLCLMGGLLYSFITGTPLGRSLFLAYSVVSDSPGDQHLADQ